MAILSDARWKKSSTSSVTGCVEVSDLAGSKEGSTHVIGVRDSKDATGPVLQFTPNEWVAFVEGVRNGEFDLA